MIANAVALRAFQMDSHIQGHADNMPYRTETIETSMSINELSDAHGITYNGICVVYLTD